jgi:hypothetical protein
MKNFGNQKVNYFYHYCPVRSFIEWPPGGDLLGEQEGSGDAGGHCRAAGQRVQQVDGAETGARQLTDFGYGKGTFSMSKAQP